MCCTTEGICVPSINIILRTYISIQILFYGTYWFMWHWPLGSQRLRCTSFLKPQYLVPIYPTGAAKSLGTAIIVRSNMKIPLKRAF